MNLLDDAIHSNGINLSGLYDFKSTVSVVFVVTGTAQSCSDTSMNVGVVRKQSFLKSMVEVCAMVNASYFTWRSSKYLWLPCIEVGIEVDDRNGTVSTVDRSQERQCDCVITSESDDSWKSLPVLCWTFLFGIGSWSSGQDRVVPFLDLVKSPRVIIPSRRISINQKHSGIMLTRSLVYLHSLGL